jgi:hypothetical protein
MVSLIDSLEFLPLVVIPIALSIAILVVSWIFQPALSLHRQQRQEKPTLTVTTKVGEEKSKSRSRKNTETELETHVVPNPPIPYDILNRLY